MSRETLGIKYIRLNKEFGEKYDAMIKKLTERINQQLNEAIERELDAMDTALKNEDLANAYYHKLKAEILFGSLFL